MPLLEAMGQGNEWNTILCLHENVATGAADGFARMGSGHCMVLLHLGPGVANGLTNIHNARRAGSKMLIVVGEIATTHQGKGSVLETNIELCAHWTDAAYFPIKSVSDVQRAALEACAHNGLSLVTFHHTSKLKLRILCCPPAVLSEAAWTV